MWDALIITPFVNVLLFIYTLVGHNFGIAIILFTILIRLITHPLTVQQLKGTQGMQKLQSDARWIEMQKKYKGDKEKLAQEQMKLYKEMGINPLGSCLPTIIQFPIIIGLYQSVIRTLGTTPLDLLDLVKHIYPGFLHVSAVVPLNSHFLWMNLGQPDLIHFSFLPAGIGLPILAIIVVITTYLQSKLLTPPSNPGDQAAAMSKAMNLYMPFLMGYLALTLASGLALYFVVSNVIGIIQYALLGKVNWRSLLPGGAKTVTVTTQKAALPESNKIASLDGKKSPVAQSKKAVNPNGKKPRATTGGKTAQPESKRKAKKEA
ncbi:MAG: YidC/Oxa1 family membrane protein insertase [Chloroflexi bacterium]|nr:YidC/Oxa1 family membrane protein insertase [Chloroflexota bacterium]